MTVLSVLVHMNEFLASFDFWTWIIWNLSSLNSSLEFLFHLKKNKKKLHNAAGSQMIFRIYIWQPKRIISFKKSESLFKSSQTAEIQLMFLLTALEITYLWTRTWNRNKKKYFFLSFHHILKNITSRLALHGIAK